nr:hypothetical protein [Deltaproteobacteria bacterium]
MSRLATLALFGALFATPALAQKAKGTKYTRNPDVKVDVKLSERTKPQPKTATEHEPLVTSELALSIEGLRGKFTAEQEQLLRNLIADTPDTEVDEKADLLFR